MMSESNQGVLYIPYFVSEAEIARFLAKYLKARVSFLHVEEKNWGSKKTIRKEEGVEREFDDSEDFLSTMGTIDIDYMDYRSEVSLYYIHNNLETTADMEKYKQYNVGIHQNMVEIQSLAKREEGIEILHILQNEYGGYLTENIQEGLFHYKEVVKAITTNSVYINERVDIMLNFNRLGDSLQSPLMQISAAQFDLETGAIIRKYDAYVNIRSFDHVDPVCVRTWIKNNPDLVSDVFDPDNEPECSVISKFKEWIDDINHHAERINIWLQNANDFEFVLRKIYNQNLNCNPFIPENIRDVRTVLDLASIKDGCFNPDIEYEDQMKEDKYQFAEQQTKANIYTLCKAYKILMPRGNIYG